MKRFGFVVVVTVALAALGAYSPVSASHSWGGYHWARSTNPLTLTLGDNVSSVWDTYLATSSSDWSQSSVLNTTIRSGSTSARTCKPSTGTVQVCSSNYGNTGWLGVAQIWVSGDHITKATVKVNDTYFNTSTYNSPAWRNLVMCQEIGHTLGLDHQDENFDNANLDTCMDYTNAPITNQHPNDHDYNELEAIYNHLDSVSTPPTKKHGKNNAGAETTPALGKLVKGSTAPGALAVYKHDLANGESVYSFVISA